jgi:hypothetical protein
MTRKHVFRPSLHSELEDRVALSHVVPVQVGVAHPRPAATTVLKHQTLNDVNRSIDNAFNRFNKEYASELTAPNRSGNSQQFTVKYTQSVAHLRSSPASQAARIPGGASTLNADLQSRVDTLVHDLATSKTIAPSNLIRSDQSGAHADVNLFVHDEAARGDLSIR